MRALEFGIVSGIGLGCAYALVALGYNVVVAACGVFNLAQSASISAGIVVSYWLLERFATPIWLALLATLIVGMVLGALTDAVAVRRFLGREVLHTGLVGLTEETLVTTLGFSLALNAIIVLTFGSGSFHFPDYLPSRPLVLLNLPIQPIYLLMVAVAVGAVALIEMFLRYTASGLVMRTTIVDPEGASLMGSNVGIVVVLAFVTGGALSGLAAILLAPLFGVSAFVGSSISLFGFASLAIGGFGSFRGTLVGGIVVGLTSQMAQVFLTPEWSAPLILILMLMVLIIRPAGLFGHQGLFGSRAVREV
jgi:branched-chain amino acid transport system permease protein